MTDRSAEPPPQGDQDGICPECRGREYSTTPMPAL